MKLKLALLSVLVLSSATAMADCYTVYDRSNNIVYNAQTPPVDMSRPLHETVQAAFPGGHMVFGSGADCPRQQPSRVAVTPAKPSKPSPLLTDRRTAAAMGARHTILPSGVALISEPTAVMIAGLTAFPISAPTPTVAAPVLAQRSAKPETVITELHNPPLTMVQQGGMVISELR